MTGRQPPPRMEVASLLEEALARHGQGDLDGAEAGYAAVLGLEPRNFTAIHQLGVIANQRGRPGDALPWLEAALALHPRSALARLNLGIALAGLGRFEEALGAYQEAAILQPALADAHLNLGLALRSLGRASEALAALDRARDLQPGSAKVLLNRALVRQDKGQGAEALADFDLALELQPDDPDALTSRGALLQALHRPAEALADHDRALALDPAHAGALMNRGTALLDLGRPAEALASLDRSLARLPGQADALMNRGNALLQLGRLSEAEAEFDRSLAIQPDRLDALLNRANVLHRLGRHAEAVAACDRVLAGDPGHTVAHSAKIFMLDYLPELTFERHQASRRDYARAIPGAQPLAEHANDRDPDRRLVIGYVSADFRRHSAASCFGPVLANHDRAGVEIVCYSGVLAEDDATERFRRLADRWIPAAALDDDRLEARIRQDRVDILVDLSGHSTGNRLPVFARRPAPVQVTAWGHGGGTGLPQVDYQFTDPCHVPGWARPLFAESSWDLPCCITCAPPEGAPPVNRLPALANGFVTFGSLNRSAKTPPALLSLWARILSAVPESRLLLKDGGYDDPSVRRVVRERFATAGIEDGRIDLRGHTPHAEHLAACHAIDIALDSFPQNGGITTWECLWMGVPVVALLGDHPACRLSGAILGALDLGGWVAADEADYAARAIDHAGRLAELAALRLDLRRRIAAAPAGDPVRYTRAVEAAYRGMWRRWAAGSRGFRRG